jgi:hypothetical protein
MLINVYVLMKLTVFMERSAEAFEDLRRVPQGHNDRWTMIHSLPAHHGFGRRR